MKVSYCSFGQAEIHFKIFGAVLKVTSPDLNRFHQGMDTYALTNNIFYYYIWLAPRAGKMSQILRCDWLLERAKWSYLACLGLPAESRKINFPKSHVLNPLLTKLGWSRWLDSGLVLFFLLRVYGPRHTQKELGQYPAILTLHLINNPIHLWVNRTKNNEKMIGVCLSFNPSSVSDLTILCSPLSIAVAECSD